MAHRHIVGQSGTGKSTLTKQWAITAIQNGHAVCYIDPHGHDTDDFLQYIPRKRRKDVLVFDPSRYAIPWNPFDAENIPLTASVFLDSFKVAWKYDQLSTPRLDSVLYNAIVAVMEARGGLFELYLILSSQTYREHVIGEIKDPVVQRYWTWFDGLKDKERLEQVESTLNKVQALMSDSRIRAIAGRVSKFDIHSLVKDKILFLRLPQGELGIGKTALLGSLFIAQLHQACLRRDTAVPFHIFIDEVHTFAPHTIAEMLSGIRKYNVELTTVHQYLSQLDPLLRASVKANCEQYVFRLSYEDSKGFPEVPAQALQPYELEPFQAWVFGHASPELRTFPAPDFTPLPASAREIDTNMRVNYVASATSQNDELLKKFS